MALRMRRTQIYLDADLSEALDRLARRRGTSRADLIRLAARQMLAQEQSDDEDPLLGLIGLADGGPGHASLEHDRILSEHRDAADKLRARVVALGATPDANAGVWGGWAELVAKSAAAIGDDTALGALKMGEKHGQNDYEDALKNAAVDPETTALIRDTLLPRQNEHVSTLEKMK